MKFLTPQLLAAAAVAAAGAFAAPTAFAQGTFTPGTGTGTNCNPGTSSYDSVSCSVGTVTANMQAWGFTGATLSSTAAAGFQRGRIGDFDAAGFGAYTGSNESTTGNHHAFDNLSNLTTTPCGTGSGATGGSVTLSTANSGCGGSIEALFMDFGTAKVNLSNVGIGFNGGDADLSVWMWTGAGVASISGSSAAGSTTITGTTAASLTGWTLVSNLSLGAAPASANTGGTLYSSAFLITTYFGAATGGLDAGDDAFKINSFTVGTCTGTLSGGTTGTGAGGGNGASCTTTPTGVPEPGSLALAGLAIVGIAASRRKTLVTRKAA